MNADSICNGPYYLGPEHAGFGSSDSEVVRYRIDLRGDESRINVDYRPHASVFCAVSAVIALVPKQQTPQRS